MNPKRATRQDGSKPRTGKDSEIDELSSGTDWEAGDESSSSIQSAVSVKAKKRSSRTRKSRADKKQTGGVEKSGSKTKTSRKIEEPSVAYMKAQVKEANRKVTEYRVEYSKIKQGWTKAKLKYERETAEMQDAGARRMDEFSFTADPDEHLQGNFHNMKTKWRQWAKSHAAAGDVNQLSQEVKNEIAEQLVEKHLPMASLESLERFWSSATKKMVVLSALLAQHISVNMFMKPFFFLKEITGEGSQADLEKAATDLYMKGFENDPDKAKVWRSLTVGMLHPEDVEKAKQETYRTTDDNLTFQKNIYYKSLAESFEGSPAGYLLKRSGTSECVKRHKQLLIMIRDVGEFCLHLWSQKSHMKVYGFEVLSKIPFSIESDRVQPHGTMGMENDDTSRNGCTIDLLTDLPFERSGDAFGKHYQRRKIVSKGSVWLSGHQFDSAESVNQAGTGEPQISEPLEIEEKSQPGGQLASEQARRAEARSSESPVGISEAGFGQTKPEPVEEPKDVLPHLVPAAELKITKTTKTRAGIPEDIPSHAEEIPEVEQDLFTQLHAAAAEDSGNDQTRHVSVVKSESSLPHHDPSSGISSAMDIEGEDTGSNSDNPLQSKSPTTINDAPSPNSFEDTGAAVLLTDAGKNSGKRTAGAIDINETPSKKTKVSSDATTTDMEQTSSYGRPLTPTEKGANYKSATERAKNEGSSSSQSSKAIPGQFVVDLTDSGKAWENVGQVKLSLGKNWRD